MKKRIFFGNATLIIGVALFLVAGCNKTAAQQKTTSKAEFSVEGVKVTDDIDSSFKVQAEITPDFHGEGGVDFGIVGNIADGKLTIKIPNPSEEQLHDPLNLDIGINNTEGLKIAELSISTSKAYLILDNPQSGGGVWIWYANKDGIADFYGNEISFKQGWNFVEWFEGHPISNARVWATLKDVYEEGGYRWSLSDKF